MTVQSLFKRASRWTKGSYEKEIGGQRCYCLVGAIAHVAGGEAGVTEATPRFHRMIERAYKAIAALYGAGGAGPNPGHRNMEGAITAWNDDPARTIDEVRRVARRARI